MESRWTKSFFFLNIRVQRVNYHLTNNSYAMDCATIFHLPSYLALTVSLESKYHYPQCAIKEGN